MSSVLNEALSIFSFVRSAAHRLLVAAGIGLILFAAPDALAQAEVRRLDSFTYTSDAEATKGWKAQAGTPAARLGRHHAQGLQLPCTFSGGSDRYFWDHSVQEDLSGFNGFELDLSCEHPAAIRALSVYLKSGKGWYVWTGKLSGPGRQIIPIMKNDFSMEGAPSGWNRIEAVRISVWKGELLDTALTLHALDARNNEIVVVQGTLSAPNETERTAARRSVRRMSDRLQGVGIPHDVLTDEQVIEQGLDRVRLLILPYNPTLPKKELETIRRFTERGGRLLVFYSSDAALAELMHLKLGEYKSAKGIGNWSSFVFENPEGWHVPAEIFQESWNIRSAYPADSSAQIIARWKNVSGEWMPDPALTAGPQGVWMAHILLDDDALAKQRMLLGLVAHYYPEVWARAAWLCLHRAGRIASANSLGESVEMILSASRDQVRWQAQVDVLVKQARQLFSRMLDQYEARKFAQVADDYIRLRDKLMDAYALVQTPKIPEFRGVWDHTGAGLYPGDWNKTCRLLAQQGVTAIFPNIAWGGVAHFESSVLPRSATFERYGDQLEQCVKAARRYGLEVHPWVICWNLTGAPEDAVNRFRKEDRLLVTENGKTYPWLNPVHPANQELGRAVIRELVARYDIDGVHLDYIRFPASNVGLGAYTRGRFERSLGRAVQQWPGDVLRNGAHARAFAEWRAGVLTEYVRDVQRTIRDVKPAVRLSAAVYGAYPDCSRTIAQDWGEWVKRRYVDFVAPMNYAQSGAEFRRLVSGQTALSGARGRIYPGIGVTSTESQLTADQVIEQIGITREMDCPGFMLFDLDPTLRDKILPPLSVGITRKRLEAP